MKSARTGVSALSGILHVTVIICRCGNFMVRTQISLAVVVLLVCSWLPPHAQGSVVARLRAAGEAQKQSAASTTPDRTDVARRERGTQEPRQLDVADSLRGVDAQARPAPSTSSRRKAQPPSSDADDSVSLEAPLDTAPSADVAPHEPQPTQPPAVNDQAPIAQPATDDPQASVKPAKEFSPEMIRLRNKIRSCLSYYYQRPTSVTERSPWGIMHSLISFGVDTELLAGGQRVNAIGWLCYNRPCKGMTLLTVRNDQLATRSGPGYQGHEGQLLSMLALSRVKMTYPIRVEGHDFTVADLVKYEQRTCRPKSELTFQLIGLAHYLNSDATWENDRGEEWSIPRMIREELAMPVVGAACGGTHRLIGLSTAVKTREKRGEPLDGEWLRAHKFVTAYQKYAFKLQNADGSFSTSWLERRDASGDMERRLQTTGHILEWLVFSLPEKDLTDPRLVKSVNYLATLLFNNRSEAWEIGPRGHALRALVLYNERVFGDKPGELHALLARRPGK
jgi:hypothetical protein